MDTTTTQDPTTDPEPVDRPRAEAAAPAGGGPDGHATGCTQAQLRRFIKSRPYVPMHELRRRFELNGQPDEVTPIQAPDGTIWIGLPHRESGFMAELLRQGDIGVELCRDPSVRIVVGVFAMRPVSR
jgi:hypothetical protein